MNPTWQTKTLKLPCPVTCGVISDTHASCLEPMYQEALLQHFAGLTWVIHLGDVTCPAVISDLETLGFSVIPVKGNNDRLLNTPQVVLMESGPWRVGATHGGGGGYLEVSRRSRRQVQSICDVPLHAILHGHSHVPTLTELDGIVFFNPGSLGHPRTFRGMDTPECPSIGIMEITHEAIRFRHIFLENSLTG